ncbi:putative phage integrase [Pseudomonas amygdali pv. lachrymans str. M302278]|nr:putative phage integrase [Pseudomonas amygdali pv. lachrymans str. M302278]
MELLRGLEQQGILEQMSRMRLLQRCLRSGSSDRPRREQLAGGVHKFLSSGKVENYAHVSAEELPALLHAIQSYPHAKDVQLGLRLLALLAVRPSELREAQWSEFDLEKKLWTIPVERKGWALSGCAIC